MLSSAKLMVLDVSGLGKKIRHAQSIIVTTHKQCDGDGLGAGLGLFHALKKLGKDVRFISVDAIPKKYQFLEPQRHIEVFDGPHSPIETSDLALVFDTNDRRMVEPLYTELETHCREVLFVDHHPVLNQGPEPTLGSYIDTRAASTGEISYFLIRDLGVRLDKDIARALYTSIAFDTQVFRYVKGAPNSHLISAELLEHERNPEEIHRHLFATHSQGKMAFLANVLGELEYHGGGKIALLLVKSDYLVNNGLEVDDSRDLIDMIMNINTVQAAALFREDGPNSFKMSLRSKGKIEVLGIAENLGGGGHMYAAGALISADYPNLREKVLSQLLQRLGEGHPAGLKKS